MRKKYQIDISEPAKEDVAAYHDRIARDKPKAAAKWVKAFDGQVRSLRHFPERYEIIPEADDIQILYRHIAWGNYRIIYKIEDSTVTVVRVIHAGRLLTPRYFGE